MSNVSVSRSERILNVVSERLGITECGKQWLIAALDPYHDAPLMVDGYPDVLEASSVVQTIKLSAQLAVPSTVSAGNNWDCHIHQFPWMTPSKFQLGAWVPTSSGAIGPSADTGYINIAPGISGLVCWFGGVSVMLGPSGQNTFYAQTPTNEVTYPFAQGLAPYLVGGWRLIAQGYEVINTTSELNVQGLVTCYRQPMENTESAKSTLIYGQATGTNPTPYIFGWLDTVNTAMPPINIGEAMLLEGTKQWKAKEGCYVVPTLNCDELPLGSNATVPISSLSLQDGAYGSTTTVLIPAFTGPAAINIPLSSPTESLNLIASAGCNLTSFNHSGAYFTGLSYSTTLTINATFIVEKFPSQQDTALVVLAKPSARYDPKALELYSEIIRMMPVGVPQRMNGLGEWFADAVSAASDFISPVLSAIPFAGTQIAARALQGAGAAAQKYLKPVANAGQEAPGKVYSATGSSASQPTSVVVYQSKKAQPKKKKAKVLVIKKHPKK